ncbi:MAG: hypothetical protein IJI27_00135, partial [Oscillospiraceae bacterium]|nr:hypothetical protein [Oscillospiraceae bacterium]
WIRAKRELYEVGGHIPFTCLAEFARQGKSIQIVFPATCAVEKLLWASATLAPRFDQTGQSPVR